MAKDGNEGSWLFLGGAAVGAAGYALWKQHRDDEAAKSRMELDDPELAYEVALQVLDLLGDLEFEGEFGSEAEFHNLVEDYLDKECEYEVEREPSTPYGRPDLLVGGAVAIELKVNLKGNERNRLVGQVLNYSRQWITVVLLADTPRSRVQDLEFLFKDKGIEQIPVIAFA